MQMGFVPTRGEMMPHSTAQQSSITMYRMKGGRGMFYTKTDWWCLQNGICMIKASELMMDESWKTALEDRT